jgi:predicted aspartyl protease
MDSVGFQLVGGAQPLVLVPASVNGEGPFQFVFDTGAGISLLDPALARRLGVEKGEVKEGRVAGGRVEVSLGRVDALRVGGALVEDLQVALLDLSDLRRATGAEVDGDLGYNFLQHFAVTLDYQARELRLVRGGAAASGGETADLPFRLGQPSKPLVLVPVLVNGMGPYSFALDTGASMTLVAPDLAQSLGIHGQPAPAITTGGGHTTPVSIGRAGSIAIGTAVRHDLPILIAGFLGPLGEAVGEHLDGVIGYNFLNGFEVTLDYPAERLRLM